MKRFFLLVAAVAVLLPGRISAQTETGSGMPFNMSAGLSLGIMDGLGAELAFGVLDNPQNCFTTETGEAGCNVLRDFLTVMVETDEEELIPTGRTLGDYLDLEAEVDDWR